MYDKLLKAIIENDADIAECGYYVITQNYKNLREYPLAYKIILGNYECSYNYMIKNNTTNFNVNKLYKSSIFEDIRYSNYKFSEDYVVNVKAFYKCNIKVTISDCCYYYVTNHDSATNQKFIKEKLDIINAGKEALSFYEGRLPELSKYVIIYILDNIRKLYLDLMDTEIKNKQEYKKILVNEYKYYYKLIDNKLHKLVKYNKTVVALWLFYKSPSLYHLVEKIR